MIPGLPAGMELIVILLILLLIFGVGRIGKIGGELGSAIRQFRESLGGGEKPDDRTIEGNDQNTKPAA